MQELHVCCLKASCVIFCLQKRMHTMNAAALKDAAEAVGKFTAAMSHWKCTIALFPHTTDCTSFNQSIAGHQAITPVAVSNCDSGGWICKQSHWTRFLHGNEPISIVPYTVCHLSNHWVGPWSRNLASHVWPTGSSAQQGRLALTLMWYHVMEAGSSLSTSAVIV